jgi:hypothetical protein
VKSISGLEIEIHQDDLQHAMDGHSEINLEKVKLTLKNPSRIVESKKQNGTCLFYSIKIESGGVDIFICVVVAVIKQGKGKIVTAYETETFKNGKILFSSEG